MVPPTHRREQTLTVALKERLLKELVPPRALPGSRREDVASSSRWLKPYGAYLVLQALQLAALFGMAPRLFWVDDAVRQFGPMAWWLGRNLRDGKPPLMDPDLGMASNLASDMQYGVLDPLHWVFHYIAGRFDNFVALSWFYGSVSVLLLGTGALGLLLHYRVRPPLAVAGAIGIASSGFFIWYGSSWWPLLWSTAWLPWLWTGLAIRRWYAVPVVGLAAWAILASGNPYALPFALLILVGQLWEQRREYGSLGSVLTGHIATRLTACAGGMIAALPALLTTIQISPLMGRERPDPAIGNNGFGVPNLVDAVVGGMTLMGQTNSWGGDIQLAPAMASMLAALPLLALVAWRKAIRAPGVLTCLLVYAAAILFTQLPTTVGPFRFPFRYLVIAQVMLPLLALIAVSAAPNLDRVRFRVAGVLIAAQFALSVLRAPFLFGWHLAALAMTAAAFFAARALLRNRAEGRRALLPSAAAIICLVTTAPFVGTRMMIYLQERVHDIEDREARERGGPPPAGRDWDPDIDQAPFRAIFPGYQLGVTVDGYRSRSYALNESLTVITTDFGEDSGWHTGVLAGNGNLVAGLKPGFGSLAVWHEQLNEHWCRDYVGATCGEPSRLLEKAKGTSKAWIEVLSMNTVVVREGAPEEISEYFEDNWVRSFSSEHWVEYGRPRLLPGRVAVTRGVEVADSGWVAQTAYAGRPMDVYRVTTGEESSGSLIFRIAYWPGLTARIDGNPVPVSSVEQAVLKIDLPPGLSDAKLEIFYEPVGAKIATPAMMLGIGVILASVLALPVVARRRRI